LSKYLYLLNPLKTGILAFELISHKLLRWLCPVFMVTLFLSNLLLLQSKLFLLFFILQSIFYMLAITGKMSKKSTIPFFLLIPYYFTLINFASLVAIVDFLRGKNKVFWEPLR